MTATSAHRSRVAPRSLGRRGDGPREGPCRSGRGFMGNGLRSIYAILDLAEGSLGRARWTRNRKQVTLRDAASATPVLYLLCTAKPESTEGLASDEDRQSH